MMKANDESGNLICDSAPKHIGGGTGRSDSSVIGCDIYNGQLTGDKAVTLTASACVSATHSGPSVIVLNDQGGQVMDISTSLAACLRAQDHGHPPIVCLNFQGSKGNNVASDDGKAYSLNAMHGHDMHVVCFEPGIMSRDCSSVNRAYENVCSTLRAQMGDNQPAVCYAIDHVITTGGNCTAQGPCVYDDLCPTLKASGAHAVCFHSDQRSGMNSIGISRSCLKGGDGSNGGMPVEENIIPSMTANGCGAVCYQTKDKEDEKKQNHLPESMGQPE